MSDESGQKTFYKYPKTLHLLGSEVVDDDESVEISGLQFKKEEDQGIEVKLIVQEKVDGANVGLHFRGEWEPLIQKRSGLIEESQGEKRQYEVFRQWVWEHAEELYEVVGKRYVLFGEWCWAEHSVSYNALPSYFIAFDCLDKVT